MSRSGPRWLTLALVSLVFGAACTARAASRDALWQVVQQCVDPQQPGYCARCPAPVAGACPGATSCRQTTEVWGSTERFVAIRDSKMCDCPPPFVHGIALPRTRVTGIEDPNVPPDIWAFAWLVAVEHIADRDQIALVANPPGIERTQDQLHIHMVRLAPSARERIAARGARTTELATVSATARTLATSRGLSGYGVVVIQARPGEFLVDVSATNLEHALTIAVCPTRAR